MPEKKSVSQKRTVKTRKWTRVRAVRQARKRMNMRRRKIHDRLLSPISRTPIRIQESGTELEVAEQPLDIKRVAAMERANLETVEQLAEEGQIFEAEVLAGVHEAEEADETEVTTHEALADDVPAEYEPER